MAEAYPNAEQVAMLDRWLDQQGFSPRLPARDFAGFRCGLYALRMVDDWIYIGQTTRPTTRMRAHRSRFDVASVQFLEAAADELDTREENLIHGLQSLPFSFTHNKSYVSFPSGRGLLAQYISDNQEQDFLIGRDPNFSPQRQDHLLTRHKTERKFELIRNWEHFHHASTACRYYVRNCIPEPATTEGHFWMISCLPYYNNRRALSADYVGDLFRINVYRQEVFFVFSSGEAGLGAVGFLSPSILDAAWPDRDSEDEALLTAAPSFQWEERFWPSGGGDQQSFSVALNDLVPLLQLPPVLRAVRRFVVGLARKGAVWWQQSHCPALADLVFDT
jgi:hypothetical protein